MNLAKRNYKDNTFCALFSEKENLIELYNALSGSSFDMDTPVEIVTLENTFFGDRCHSSSITGGLSLRSSRARLAPPSLFAC